MSFGRDVVINIIGNDKLSRVLDSAAGKAAGAAARIDRAGKKLSSTGAVLSKAITLPVVAAAAVSIHAATDFQKSVTLLNTAGGESVKNLSVDAAGMKRIAVQTGSSLDQLGAGMYTVEKAGYRGAAALKVEKAAAQGAKAENADLATSTNALTSVMMSYHKSASQSVAVENEIVKAAGMSKTTYQEYASSLSTVIPIASAARISFAQVAAAEATLTQHGTSADESTQELANTIRNLQAPNQVAQKAMQQLGLNVNNVSKNLGKRGLTGTINLLVDAIAKKMGPSGLVAVSAFKKSQSASQDLNIELSKMPEHLQQISQDFAHGKMSYKDYYTAVKDLGGQQFELGKSFISTMSQAKGFNNLLKSGQPAAQTFAAYLKQVMGGATGLNTALMLGGHNMSYFEKAEKRVAAAGKDGGKNISTWAKTLHNTATQQDILKAKLQVLEVNIGQKLLPIWDKVITAVGKAVDWFSNLSDSTQNNIIKWGLLAAAIGPVLAIVGNVIRVFGVMVRLGTGIGRFATFVATQFTSITTGAETMSASVERGVRGLSAALTGAGVGMVIGNLTKNSSNATKAVGALGSALTGAAIGAGIGGLPGALIGGAAGALSSLATSFLGAGDAADKGATKEQIAAQRARAAIEKQRQAVGDLTQAILSDNNAIGANTKASISNALQKSGALTLAQKLKLNLGDVTKAVLGNQAAQQRLNEKLGKISPTDIASELNASKLRLMLRGEGVDLRDAAYKADQLAAAQGKLKLSARGVSQEYARYGHTLGGATHAGQMNMQFIKAHVKALNDERKSGKLTDRQYADQLGALQKVMHQYKFNGDAVTAYIKRFAKLPKSVITKLLADPKNATWATKMVLAGMKLLPKSHNTDLKATDKATGLAARLQARINAIKQGKIPSISLNTAQGLSELQTLEERLQALHNKNVTVFVHTQNSSSGRLSGAKQLAAGGGVHGPGGPTADKVPALLSNGEHVLTASDVDKLGGQGAVYRMRRLIQGGMLRLAGGGAINKHKGKNGHTYWSWNGHHYDSLKSAQDARASAATSKVGGAVGHIGAAAGAKFYVKDVGIDRIRKQIKQARKVLDREIGNGLSKHAAQKYRDELKRYTKLAQRQLAALKVKIAKPDTKALKHALMGTFAEARAAFKTLITDAKHAGAGSAEIKKLGDAEDKLIGKMHNRAKVMKALATARDKLSSARSAYRQDRSAVRSSVSAFDVTSVTSVFNDRKVSAGNIVRAVKKAAANAKKFVAILKKLTREGMPKALIDQLAQAGPAAGLDAAEALEKATPKQLASIKSSYKTLAAAGKDAGKFVADHFYGQGVKSAKKLVDGLKSKRDSINKAIRDIAKGMIKQLDKSLDITRHSHHHKHGTRKGDRTNPPHGHHHKHHDNGHQHKKPKNKANGDISITVNGYDPERVARIVARRLRREQQRRANV